MTKQYITKELCAAGPRLADLKDAVKEIEAAEASGLWRNPYVEVKDEHGSAVFVVMGERLETDMEEKERERMENWRQQAEEKRQHDLYLLLKNKFENKKEA